MENFIVISIIVTTICMMVSLFMGAKSVAVKLMVAALLQGAYVSSFVFMAPVAGYIALGFVFMAICTALAANQSNTKVILVGGDI